MRKKSHKKSIIIRGMIVLHFIITAILFFACWQFAYAKSFLPELKIQINFLICIFYTVVLLLLSRIYNAYKVGYLHISEIIYNQVIANLVSLGLTYIIACIRALKLINPVKGVVCAIIQTIIGIGWAVIANKTYFFIHKPKKTVVVYRNNGDLRKLKELRYFENRWKIENVIKWNEKEQSLEEEEISDIHDLLAHVSGYEAVFVSGVNASTRNGIVKYCVEEAVDCYFVPHTGDVIISGAEHMQSFAIPIFRTRRSRLAPELMFVKRAIDILFSLIAIIFTSPFMIITALGIKLYDGGPVLYKQVRLTKDGACFNILKFRSMKIDAEKDGVARLASKNDNRITPIGKIIRAIRFDELPQLFNILCGDMSIVGPRPERPEIAEQYLKELPAFELRLQVKAGLTGYAQIYGRYNTEPVDKLKMDLMYINNISIKEDIKLMFATVRILFMKDSTAGVEKDQLTAHIIDMVDNDELTVQV